MKRKYIILLIFIVWMLVPITTASAVDGGHLDEFGIMLKGTNEFSDGWGTGWRDPKTGWQWFLYNEDETQPNPWWNQWFYDDPPSWDRWKHIEYTIKIDPLLTDPVPLKPSITVGVALNWSTMEYPETGISGTPPMPSDEDYINRYIVYYEDWLTPGEPYTVQGEYDILKFNPEWVSIDVWAEAWDTDAAGNLIPLAVTISGQVYHVCVPEPASLILLGFGALALLKKKR